MSTVSAERQQELLADYQELKNLFLEVDNKYSLNYNSINMDFPESLGLEKLTFTAMTNQEVQDLAEQEVSPAYTRRLQALTSNYNLACANVQLSQTKATATHTAKVAQLAEEYRQAQIQLMRKLVNNGLLHSGVRTQAENSALDDYEAKLSAQTDKYDALCNGYTEKLGDLSDNYEAAVDALESEKAQAVQAAVQALRDKEEKNRVSIQKYNSSVNEKEAKYKASCERSLQYAKQAEYDRALAAAKIYSELGATGVENLKCSEKLEFSKLHFASYTLDEANFVLSIDGAMMSNLGNYYSTFTNWVSQTLS